MKHCFKKLAYFRVKLLTLLIFLVVSAVYISMFYGIMYHGGAISASDLWNAFFVSGLPQLLCSLFFLINGNHLKDVVVLIILLIALLPIHFFVSAATAHSDCLEVMPVHFIELGLVFFITMYYYKEVINNR